MNRMNFYYQFYFKYIKLKQEVSGIDGILYSIGGMTLMFGVEEVKAIQYLYTKYVGSVRRLRWEMDFLVL